jgi:hypothetical protein
VPASIIFEVCRFVLHFSGSLLRIGGFLKLLTWIYEIDPIGLLTKWEAYGSQVHELLATYRKNCILRDVVPIVLAINT